MNEEKNSSKLEKEFQNSKTVSKDELPELLKTGNIWDIVCVKDEGNKAYVLLGHPDNPESRVWANFNGEDKKTLQSFLEWMEEGKKLYSEKARSPDELDYLRKVMLSIGCLSELMNDEQFTNVVLQMAVGNIALKWYMSDHPDDVNDVGDKITPYIELVMRYVERLSNFIRSIKENAATFDDQEPKR